MWGKILTALIIVGVILYLVLTYEHSLICGIANSINKNFGNFLGCNSSPKTGTGNLPNSQIINSSIGNNINASYSSQYKIAVDITKKYNESIKHLILFTGNSSNESIENMNQYEFSTAQGSLYYIKYNGLYVPIAQNVSGKLINKTNSSSTTNYIPSLVGDKIYILFVAVYDNNLTIQVPYIVQSEKITNGSIGKFVYWHLTQDTGISNSTAINVNNESLAQSNITVSSVAGMYYNNNLILFPTG